MKKRICMLAYTDYESDGRIIRYSETLAKRGDEVEVIAYSKDRKGFQRKNVNGVDLIQLQKRGDNESGPISHLLPLIEFFFRSLWFISIKQLKNPYDVIHVHNIPEWLVFAAVIPKLRGARLVLDIHDIVPELYSAKFKKGKSKSAIEMVLKVVEKVSCGFADHVIISNHLWKDKLVKRSVREEKCSVFFNNIDCELFFKHDSERDDGKKIILFPGTLQWHQGVDIAIKAMPEILRSVPNAEFHIYGGGGVKNELKALVVDMSLQDKVRFFDFVPVTEMAQIIANADIGVVPKRADSFGNEAYSTKIMEFMSQGVPVVISQTAIDEYYFNDSEVRFFESGNVAELADGVVEVLNDDVRRKNMIQNSLEYVARNHWGSRKQEYLDLVDSSEVPVDPLINY